MVALDDAPVISSKRDESFPCVACGQTTSLLQANPPVIPYSPWRLKDFTTVIDYVSSLSEETYEWLIAIYVDEYLNLLSAETMAQGGAKEVDVPVAKIMRRAVVLGAAGFFLVHNHPKGDATPSEADQVVTRRLNLACEALDVVLLEHIVIAKMGAWGILRTKGFI